MGYLVETSGRILLPESLERQALTVLEVRMAGQQGWYDDEVHVDSLEELASFAAASFRREGDWLVVGTDEDGDPKWSEQATEFYRTLGTFVREGEVHVEGEDGQSWSYHYTGDGVVQRGDNGWDGTPGDDVAPSEASWQAPPSPPAAPPAPPSAAPAPPVPSAGPTEPEPQQFRYPGSEDRPEPAPSLDPAPPLGPPSAPYGPPAGGPVPPAPGAEVPGQGVPDYRAERAWADPPPASTGRTLLMTALLVIGVILIIGLALMVSGL